MPGEMLRTDYSDATAYKVAGKVINLQNGALNAIKNGHVIQRGASGIDSIVKTDLPPVPFVFGIAVVSPPDPEIGNCPADSTEQSGYGFPCPVQDKYIAEFRYYDTDEGIWIKYGETYEVDVSGYYEPTDSVASKVPASGPGYGPIPHYAAGDVFPAYLDVHRGKIIPVQTPYCDDPSAVFFTPVQSPIEEAPGVPPVCEFYVEILRPTVDADFITVGVIAFPLVYPDIQTGTYDSSTVFNTVPCPHGTLFRVRAVRGRDASDGSDIAVAPVMQRLRFIGIGRRSPSVVANCTPDSSFVGGDPQQGWRVDASTNHRLKDAPRFNTANNANGVLFNDLIQVTYLDEQDEWMIGVELYVRIQIGIDEFSSSSSSTSSSSLSSSSSSSSSSSVSSSSESSLSSSSMSNSLSTSSSSQSISTSSSSQSRSTSSSSGYDCIRVPTCYQFNATTCKLTITWAEICFPRGSGVLIQNDVPAPC